MDGIIEVGLQLLEPAASVLIEVVPRFLAALGGYEGLATNVTLIIAAAIAGVVSGTLIGIVGTFGISIAKFLNPILMNIGRTIVNSPYFRNLWNEALRQFPRVMNFGIQFIHKLLKQ